MWNNTHVNLTTCNITFLVFKDTSTSSRAGNLLLVQPSGTSSTTSGALSLLFLTKRLKDSPCHMPWKTMSRKCHQKWTLLVFSLKSITALFQTSLTPTYNYIDFPETAHRSWHTEIKNIHDALRYQTKMTTITEVIGKSCTGWHTEENLEHSWWPAVSNTGDNHHRNHRKIIQKSSKNQPKSIKNQPKIY